MNLIKTLALTLTIVTASSCNNKTNKTTSEKVSEVKTEQKKKKL
ncbi:hypothetical protein [Lacinutrix mariniflava]|nr:hypothetical protein [Lacinutrix mariniflava]